MNEYKSEFHQHQIYNKRAKLSELEKAHLMRRKCHLVSILCCPVCRHWSWIQLSQLQLEVSALHIGVSRAYSSPLELK